MARHTGPVLVDTNVIIECWRAGAWNALVGGYDIETVETCFVETQTGFQRRRPEHRIDSDVLKATIKNLHSVSQGQLAIALTEETEIAFLDAGEKDLWAHAMGRTDGWVLCGPDKASLRIGIRLGFRDRLVSLERLLEAVGYRNADLRLPYTQKWLEQTLAELAQRENK